MTNKKEKPNTITEDPSLFTPDQEIWHNACLKRASMSWYLYADGYRLAAEPVVKNCGTFYDRNTLAYPIIFLYRQYIELTLKDIIREGNKVVQTKNKIPMQHELDLLWPICRKIIKERELTISEKDIKVINSYITQFCKVDLTSMAFRYPEKKEGGTLLPPDFDSISLRGLASAMNKLASLLKKIVKLLDADIDREDEYRSYLEPIE